MPNKRILKKKSKSKAPTQPQIILVMMLNSPGSMNYGSIYNFNVCSNTAPVNCSPVIIGSPVQQPSQQALPLPQQPSQQALPLPQQPSVVQLCSKCGLPKSGL